MPWSSESKRRTAKDPQPCAEQSATQTHPPSQQLFELHLARHTLTCNEGERSGSRNLTVLPEVPRHQHVFEPHGPVRLERVCDSHRGRHIPLCVELNCDFNVKSQAVSEPLHGHKRVL